MAEAKRKLAAILSADVAGYSRLMGEDERMTLDTLNAHRGIFKKHISGHDGRVVDTAGDSVLAVFDSVVEAVQGAIDIQAELTLRNKELAEGRRMLFRIGVNLGDVLEQDDGTIYGDGVNVAARLEGLAEPGGITVSEDAFRQVEGKLSLGFDDLGEQEVKNIAKPIRAYRVKTVAVSDRHTLDNAPFALPDKLSVAVLPFANMSGDPEQEYFSDGLTEDIITALSKFRELLVVGRNSTFQYKGQRVGVSQIGRELGVRYVLEGSVRKAGSRVRINAQLIDSTSGSHLWAERYDRDLEDIFTVQDEVTQNIAAALGITLHDIVTEGTSGRCAGNFDAYCCVLRARRVTGGMMTTEEHARARKLLESAIALDPSYAHAHAVLSNLYLAEHRWGFNPLPHALERARKHALRAIELDPYDAYGHCFLALTNFFEHQIERFGTGAERALALNPNDPEIVALLGTYFTNLGKYDKGLGLVRRAMRLNPVHPGWYHSGFVHYRYDQQDYEGALAELNKIEHATIWTHLMTAAACGQLGRTTEARSAADMLIVLCSEASLAEEIRKWNYPQEHTEHMVDGLRKAGLDITEERATAD